MKKQYYRVAASCFEPEASQGLEQRREALRDHLIHLLEEQGPDLLVLPEKVIVHNLPEEPRLLAEGLSGLTVTMVADLARYYSVNICLPILEAEAGGLYNSAVYLDRKGAVAGKYRKHVPMDNEMECGILSGDLAQPPVMVDGLRVGTAICFDQNYPDLLWNWIQSGVDLLTFPAYTYAGCLMRNWALNCGVPLVAAFPWESVIYDRDGSTLVEAGQHTDTVRLGFHAPWIACNLNLQSRVYHLDGNQNLLPVIARRFGGKLDIRLMVKEARMMITSHSPDIEIGEMECEIGLEPLQTYLKRNYSTHELT